MNVLSPSPPLPVEGGTRSWDGADVDALQGLAREVVEVLESTRAA